MAYHQQTGLDGGYLYNELWKACAGPLIDVPEKHRKVYYFPQGHMEQVQSSHFLYPHADSLSLSLSLSHFSPDNIRFCVLSLLRENKGFCFWVLQVEASTDQRPNQPMSNFSLPSKILCQVVNIEFKAEPETDELYAQITLIPEPNQEEPATPDPSPPEPAHRLVRSFCKTLTASDTSTHGGFSVLRKHATECLPELDMTQETPTQELIARDLHGYEWRFKHIFRGQPRRHLLTTGWSTFVTSKRLVAGDAFVFLRGDNGELRVGVRRLSRQMSHMPPSVISSQSMHFGVLATALHALNTKTMFLVYYRPRATPFIIGLNKYLEGVNNKFTVGMRFKMKFEGEDAPERRFSGTIIGVEDISPQWPNSMWRSLKVQWDEPATVPRPERVSPWEIQPYTTLPIIPLAQPGVRSKRSRPADLSSDNASTLTASAGWYHHGLPNSHERMQLHESAEVHSRESPVMWPAPKETCSIVSRGSCSSTSNLVRSSIWPSPHAGDSIRIMQERTNINNAVGLPSVSANPAGVSLVPSYDEWGRKFESSAGCWLFGIDLSNDNNPSAPSEKGVSYSTKSSSGVSVGPAPASLDVNAVPSKEQRDSVSDASPSEMKSNHALVVSPRTRIKVKMQGISVGRAVDVTMLNGYDDLLDELEKLFDIKGDLHQPSKWAITFTDDENDMMLMGDDPWLEFCKMVKRIFIKSIDEVTKIKARGNPPSSSLESAGTLASHQA